MESELKLAVSPAHLHKISSQRLLQEFVVGEPVTRQLTSHYFDTPDEILRQRGLSLRVRDGLPQSIQTLKGSADGARAAGALVRGEWETPVASGEPELRALRKSDGMPRGHARVLRAAERSGTLQEQFVVQARRTTWMLRIDGATIEMALDEGHTAAEAATSSFTEVELELKSGKKLALYAAARQLARHIPVQLSFVSKSARGAALRGRGLQPQKARPIVLPAHASVEQGMRRIFDACLMHAQANVQGFLDSDDPEYLHQLRVGVRRLRSALKLFRGLAALPEALQRQLDELSALLGAARDADVLMLATLPRIADGARLHSYLQPLADRVGVYAREQRVAARDSLHTTRHAQFMLALFAWVDGKAWRADASPSTRARLRRPLAAFARRAIVDAHAVVARRARKVRKLGEHNSAALHRLRIGCKQARYAVEFFSAIERPRRAKRYVKQLSAAQEALGKLNDIHVAQGVLTALAETRPDLAGMVGVAHAYLTGIAAV